MVFVREIQELFGLKYGREKGIINITGLAPAVSLDPPGLRVSRNIPKAIQEDNGTGGGGCQDCPCPDNSLLGMVAIFAKSQLEML